jgi:hypothetical protein
MNVLPFTKIYDYTRNGKGCDITHLFSYLPPWGGIVIASCIIWLPSKISPNVARVIKARRMRWAGHVARMVQGRGVYRVLIGKPAGKRPLGRPRRRWEDNIKMDLREKGIDGANWIRLAQDRVQWRAFVNTVMNLRVP